MQRASREPSMKQCVGCGSPEFNSSRRSPHTRKRPGITGPSLLLSCDFCLLDVAVRADVTVRNAAAEFANEEHHVLRPRAVVHVMAGVALDPRLARDRAAGDVAGAVVVEEADAGGTRVSFVLGEH